MKDVSGKIGFITGRASGLGVAMAKTFLDSGMRVARTDIEDAAIEKTKAFFTNYSTVKNSYLIAYNRIFN